MLGFFDLSQVKTALLFRVPTFDGAGEEGASECWPPLLAFASPFVLFEVHGQSRNLLRKRSSRKSVTRNKCALSTTPHSQKSWRAVQRDVTKSVSRTARTTKRQNQPSGKRRVLTSGPIRRLVVARTHTRAFAVCSGRKKIG